MSDREVFSGMIMILCLTITLLVAGVI